MTEEKTLTKPPKLYQALTMSRAKKIADELVKFVKANGLSVQIAGNDYLLSEAWQFVGETQMGLTQVVVSCESVPSESPEIKYKAVVEILNQQGTVVSRGFAFASSLEKGKNGSIKWKDEYAVASMSQTRAIGKAYRNILAWIVKMAGYEATPAEEIDKDKMETELSRAKQRLYKEFKDRGVEDTAVMKQAVETATGKPEIETVEDAELVIAELEAGDDK